MMGRGTGTTPKAFAVLLALGLVLSCGEDDGGSGPGSSLVVSPASLSIADCVVGQISATVQDADGNPVSAIIAFTSDDPSIATVNAAGDVTGQGAGTTSIAVTSANLQTSIPVVVTASPLQILSPDTVFLHPTESRQITASVVDCHLDPVASPVTFAATNGTIADVTVTGNATGAAYGTTSFTLTSVTGNKNLPVRVIGFPLGDSLAAVTLPNQPFGVAIHPSSGILYVTQIGSFTAARGSVPLESFPGSAIVGTAPAHVAMDPDGGKAYVTNQHSGTVSVITVGPNVTSNTITIGGEPYNLIVSPDGGTVYASVEAGQVYLINTATESVVDSFSAISQPNGFAFSPDGTTLYVSSRGGGAVVVYDTLSNTVLDTLVTGGVPQRIAVSADGSELYIANEALGLDIWNLNTATRITTVAMPAYGLALSPDDAVIFVSDAGGGVRMINRASRTIRRTLNVGGIPRNIAFSANGFEAVIPNEAGYVTVVR